MSEFSRPNNVFNINIEDNNSIDLEQPYFEDLTLETCDLRSLSYQDLQWLAKQHNIKANIKKKDLIYTLHQVKNGEQVPDDFRKKSWHSKIPKKKTAAFNRSAFS